MSIRSTHETQSLSLLCFFQSFPFFIEKLRVDAYNDISLTSPLVFTHKFLISLSITHVFALCALTQFLSAQQSLTLSLCFLFLFSLCFLLVLPKEHAFICYSTLPMWAVLLCHFDSSCYSSAKVHGHPVSPGWQTPAYRQCR